MVAHHKLPGVHPDSRLFTEVHKSENDFVKIYKILSVSRESKEWVERNRICDSPGSWYCPGRYPPALEEVLMEKRDFAQLEDFNRGAGDKEYTKEYLEKLERTTEKDSSPRKRVTKLPAEEIKAINEQWKNTKVTHIMWEFISGYRFDDLRNLLIEDPAAPHVRSEDGRGPMWWAHEHGHKNIVELLKRLGVSENEKDANGQTPLDVSKCSLAFTS